MAHWQIESAADAVQVAPHVAALDRVEVERRIVPSLCLEYRSKQEGTPRDLDAGRPCHSFDTHRRRVGVGAGKFEPELESSMSFAGSLRNANAGFRAAALRSGPV